MPLSGRNCRDEDVPAGVSGCSDKVLVMTLVDRSHIRVKAMLVAPNNDFTAHAVSLNPPTAENPDGYHRLIGGGVELGETHRDAMLREVDEELGATIRDLTFLTAVESIFRIDGTLGHEIVFLYVGRLDPLPSPTDASLTEIDGSVVPVVWRPIDDEHESLPLYPSATVSWVRSLSASGDAR
jgi:ADP-ribose pyrophosphatase YjhB (NUDIX family)